MSENYIIRNVGSEAATLNAPTNEKLVFSGTMLRQFVAVKTYAEPVYIKLTSKAGDAVVSSTSCHYAIAADSTFTLKVGESVDLVCTSAGQVDAVELS